MSGQERPAAKRQDCPHISHGEFTLCEVERARRAATYPPPVGRSLDPDWSPALVVLAVAWFAVVCVGAYFFWSSV